MTPLCILFLYKNRLSLYYIMWYIGEKIDIVIVHVWMYDNGQIDCPGIGDDDV